MMSGPDLVLAVIVAAAAQIGPLLLAHQITRARSKEKKEDWARQDEVAKRAAESSKAAQVAAAEVKTTLAENEVRSRATLKEIVDTGEKTHTLVNSNMGVQLKLNAAVTKRLAGITKDPDDISAAHLASVMLAEHEKKQATVDASNNKKKRA